jgi:hypothetical protein
VVDKDAAHDPCRYTVEMRPILPVDVALFDQPQVRLVNERGWLERMARAFVSKLTGGNPAQLGIHERQQTIEGASIATTPVVEQLGDVVTCGHWQPEALRNQQDRGSSAHSQAGRFRAATRSGLVLRDLF